MIMLNVFNWKDSWIYDNIPVAAEVGYNALLLSPVTQCNAGDGWYKLYQMLSLGIGNRNVSELGLRAVCSRAHEYDLKVYVDVVIRHVASKSYDNPTPHWDADRRLIKYFVDCRNANTASRYDEVKGGWGLARLDYEDIELQENEYRPFFRLLRELGVDGIRLDMGKHFALPEDKMTDIGKRNFWEFMDSVKQETGLDVTAEILNASDDTVYKYTRYCKPICERYRASVGGTVRFIESHDTYYHREWGVGCTADMKDNQRLDAIRDLSNRHNNVLVFARPNDNIIFSETMKDICHNTKAGMV